MDWFRRYWRMVRIQLGTKRGPALTLDDVSVVKDRVWLTDNDELRHMNNGVYLSLLDHARFDLMLRSGTWAKLRAAKMYPVVTAQTISYRKSLEFGQKFTTETKIIGYDGRSVFIEQRLVRGGEIYARAYVLGRFLRDAGGVVPLSEVGEVVGVDIAAHPAPAWLVEWAEHNALPSTRAPAPNEW